MSTVTQSAPSPEKISDNEYSTVFAVPVTLRQVEAARIDLEGSFGIDATEHAEMLDEAGLLRLTFGVELTDDNEIVPVFGLETFECRPWNTPAAWHSCTANYYSAKGWVDRQNYQINTRRVEDCLRAAFPEFQGVLDEASTPLEEAAQANREAIAYDARQQAIWDAEEDASREMGGW